MGVGVLLSFCLHGLHHCGLAPINILDVKGIVAEGHTSLAVDLNSSQWFEGGVRASTTEVVDTLAPIKIFKDVMAADTVPGKYHGNYLIAVGRDSTLWEYDGDLPLSTTTFVHHLHVIDHCLLQQRMGSCELGATTLMDSWVLTAGRKRSWHL